jgi:hypothetical protein
MTCSTLWSVRRPLTPWLGNIKILSPSFGYAYFVFLTRIQEEYEWSKYWQRRRRREPDAGVIVGGFLEANKSVLPNMLFAKKVDLETKFHVFFKWLHKSAEEGK